MQNYSIIHPRILSISKDTFVGDKVWVLRTDGKSMIYRERKSVQHNVQMQPRTGAKFIMVNNPHVGQFEIENMEILLARTKTSLPTKPRDIRMEFRGGTAFSDLLQ